MSFHRLLALYERQRPFHQPLVLCTVVRTGGSTYAKPGAQMLIAADGEYAGLLSGGCLEGDLREHARKVVSSGEARIVSYDLRSSTDQLFGLGAGCEGAMDILLTRVSAAEVWEPLAHLAAGWSGRRTGRIGLVISPTTPGRPLGFTVLEPTATCEADLFVVEVPPPPRLLLAGAGPDSRPVATLAAFLGWDVILVDHRASYLDAAKFPAVTRLIECPAAQFAQDHGLADIAAAVVMSHHLESDLHYLRALAHSDVPYVGLLGPAARREKLLADLGADAALLRPRLRAPVGLDIGGRSPESIALSIIGEVHAALHARAGRPFSEVTT
jgi:xanthine dehydrogenase accessory factor